MNTITVQIDPEDDDVDAEQFSIANLKVVDPSGNIVVGARVELCISTQGLLSLGKSLIRLSESSDQIAHLRQSSPKCAVCYLGIYLHPESAEMLMIKQEFGTISDLLLTKC